MIIIRAKNYEDLSVKAARVIASKVMEKTGAVIGLATGSTPVGTYANLSKWCNEGVLDFADTYTVNLDEYKGLPTTDEQSYRYFMDKNLFNNININKDNTYLPNGTVLDSAKACSEYDAIIDGLGGIDLQLLGIGHNGHIGFNEPADEFVRNTNCVDLTPSTIEANKRFFEDESQVPRQAYTMGIGTIMQAKKILLVISGKEKAQILKDSLYGPITPQVPASILQLHPNLVLVADEDALSLV